MMETPFYIEVRMKLISRRVHNRKVIRFDFLMAIMGLRSYPKAPNCNEDLKTYWV